MTNSSKELHLVIIWENGRHKENEVLEFLNSKFEVVEKYKIKWDKALFGKNLTTFYGKNLPPNSGKEKHVGNGEFLLITFYDKMPIYEYSLSSKGTVNVNINLFRTKEKLRNLTGGGHKIHSTNTTEETNHDLILLLGVNYDDYETLINLKNKYDNNNVIKEKLNNITGVNGWKNLKQLFYVLNHTTEYVVLRNFEELPDNYHSKIHGDIDLLVKDLLQTVIITNAIKIHKSKDRVHYKIKIGGEFVFFDLRYIGDNYYDEIWQKKIIKNRILSDKNFYHPEDYDYFYTLIYHALIHKSKVAVDYPEKIKNIYKKLAIFDNKKCDFDNYLSLLNKFLYNNRYSIVKPHDNSIFFKQEFSNYHRDIDELNEYNVKNITPYNVKEWRPYPGKIFFTSENSSGDKIFIKSRGISESSAREYKILNELRKIEPKYFPEPLFYKKNHKINFLAIEFIEGKRLDYFFKSEDFNSYSKIQIINFLKDLLNIIKILNQLKIVHRDISPKNIIIKKNGTPVLIDFAYSVDLDKKRYPEYKEIQIKPDIVINLGGLYAKNKFHWDDVYSLNKIINEFIKVDDPEILDLKRKFLSMIGLNEVISIKNTFFHKNIRLLKNYLYPLRNKYKVIYKLYSIINKFISILTSIKIFKIR